MRAFHWWSQTTALVFVLLLAAPTGAMAAPPDNPCARPPEGSVVAQPPDLYSRHGELNVAFRYYTGLDQWGRTLFCYVTADGLESPTLHVNPGDTLNISLTNMEPGSTFASLPMFETAKQPGCRGAAMTAQSVNMHFHGLNVSPKCHGDEIIHTLVNPGQSFQYTIKIPADEPPGLNWYHAHVHGIVTAAVQGGASGAIEVEGVANLQPPVEGLPQRFLVLRDQPLAHPPQSLSAGAKAPSADVTINYIPVSYPSYVPAVIKMQAGTQEFWRVVNASADTIMDLQIVYDGVVQPVQIAVRDGVPTGSHDGRRQGTLIRQKHVLIAPSGREEFIVTGPSAQVAKAQLITRHVDTGPVGDIDVARPLAAIRLTQDASEIPPSVERSAHDVNGTRFDGLTDSMVSAHRRLYFSEDLTGVGSYFITVDGQKPKGYDPDDPPAIVTAQGAVEDWTIENRTGEIHAFHIHQIHFKLLEENGETGDQQFWDTYPIDYWKGSGPYPYIKVRMDFRGAVVGEFVYHCHILDHEDNGMMANMRVLPRSARPATDK